MTKKRSTKACLMSSIVSLLLCFAMLLGTTWAWFTDEVTSAGNTIQSGTLKIDLLHKTADGWVSLKEDTTHLVFNYDHWEPGYTRVETLEIKNLGTLALQYRLSIELQSDTATLGKNGESLADVIDVYIAGGEQTAANYEEIKNVWEYKGTLAQVLADPAGFISGQILPDGAVLEDGAEDTTVVASSTLTVALHMQDDAGNAYQGLTVGNLFINLIATQWTFEDDAFDNNYDSDTIFPVIDVDDIIFNVEVENGVNITDIYEERAGISALVPAGVAVKEGENQLVLSVKEMQESGANLTLQDGEELKSLDVHVEGVSSDNQVPIIITIEGAMKPGLNMGNYTLYHVENGVSNAMVAVSSVSEVISHNEFYYDTYTGNITLAMKSFSEIALVADVDNAWKGNFDYSWYDASKTDLAIINADQLAAFGAIVGGMNGQTLDSFKGKTVKLCADIDLGDAESENNTGVIFYPIGYNNVSGSATSYSFEGIFDGNSHVIENFYHSSFEISCEGMGLFSKVYGGTVKNLTVKSFSSNGENTVTGVIAAYADLGATFENIAIINCNPRVYNNGNGGVVGCVGLYAGSETDNKVTFRNVSVDSSNVISALWGSCDVACGGIVGQYYPTASTGIANAGICFENCYVAAKMDVYNDACSDDQTYLYRYAGMMIGSVNDSITNIKGYVIPNITGIIAKDCTVSFGSLNDYYYCELVANTLSSNTQDYSFSRLTKITSLDEIKSGDAWIKAGNFLYNGNCYHIVNRDGALVRHLHEDAGYEIVNGEEVLKEDKQIIYLPFNQICQSDKCGAEAVGIRNDSDFAFEGITISDTQSAINKFKPIVNGGSYEMNSTVTLGELFSTVDGVSVNSNLFKVYVIPVGEDSTASAIYVGNSFDWTKGTLTFNGLGALKIVITDYTSCKDAVTSITVTEPAMTDKFVANSGLSYVHTLQGGSIEKTLGDIFSTVADAKIDFANIKVEYSVSSGDIDVQFVQNTADWAASTIKIYGTGSVTFTITDQFYCNPASATISVEHPENEDKFTAIGNLSYTPKHDKETYTFTLCQLFSANVTEFVTDVVVTVNGTEYVFENGEGWADKSITLTEFGTCVVTVTDNNYCNVASATVSFNEPVTEAKFTYTGEELYYVGKTVAVGNLFAQNDGTALGNDVVVTVNDQTVYSGADWQSTNLTFDQEGEYVIVIKENSKYCEATTITVNVIKADKLETKFTGDFLYRVGNKNTVSVGTLFAAKNGAIVENVIVTIESVDGTEASGTFTANATEWEKGTIQFSGTGIVKVTVVEDGGHCIPVELYLEVIDATNITSAIGTTAGGDMVLLCDVNSSNYVNYWNCTLYGNGFTYSLKGAPTAYNSKQGHGIIITKNATLDNLVIVGDVYNSYGAYTSQDYYNAAVDALGNTTIQNCYISGCAAPVKARSNVTIMNSTLYGGAVGNLIIMSGTATLENVTTANYDDGRAVVGMGIVIHADATETAKLVINGKLTQYNFISEGKAPTDTYAQNLHNAMFGSDFSQYQFGTSPNRYVNTGIISLTSAFNGDDITDNASTGYVGKSTSIGTYSGYVYTQLNTSGSVNNDFPEYKPSTQGAVPPAYSFDYTNKNYVAKAEGSNVYCYEENGKVNISLDDGDSFSWDTSILTIGKGITNYTVSMNGTDYTGKSIVFNTAGDYTVEYTYVDDNNYKLDENGNIVKYSVTYTKKVHITVAVVEATTNHAEFTFGSSNTASTTVTVGNTTYVMPDVSGTSSTIGSTTVSGQTIYYPIVEIIMSDGKTSHSGGWYAYFPVFSGAVTITDYADNGTGDKMSPYNGSTTTMPSGLSVVGDPTQLFKYQSSSAAGSTPVVKNNKLVYSSAKIEAKRSEYSTVIQYSYTDNAGATYYYYIGYHAPAQSYSSVCLAPDTLITMADGTQKEIQHVRVGDSVIAWNFYTGEYDIVPVSLLQAHNTGVQSVLHLYFEDGTELKVLGEHGIFDTDLNTFIFIDEDDVVNYVGHSFVKQDGESFTTVKLVDYEVTVEYTTAYTILSFEHYNVIAEGMFTVTPAHIGGNFFNPFEVDEDMRYDEDAVKADVEKYGLYTYEDFDHVLTYEQFVALNLGHFKVSAGKGYVTYEGLIYLIETFINNEDYNV